MQSGSEDRRTAKRIPYIAGALVEGTRSLNDRISDLGSGGAFVETLNQPSVGSTYTLMFRLNEAEIRVSAEVRYRVPQFGTGVRFLDLDPDDRRAIERFVEGRSD